MLAAGTTNNFFNIPDLRKHVYTLKSVSQAIRCRNEVLDRLERASIATDPAERARLLTFIVVGGGPAGVEVAGALGEMKRYEVQLEKTMTSYADGLVSFTDGTSIPTETVIWTAGVTGECFETSGSDVAPGPGRRWIVDEFNRVTGLDSVFAIGDISLHISERYPKGCPQLAQVAIQQARTLGKNLNSGKFDRPFRYRDKGTMATIGRNRAVVDMGSTHLSGWIAWITWMTVHLLSLLGMRNKAVVLINWMVSYFTFSAGLRLMLRPSKYPLRSYWND